MDALAELGVAGIAMCVTFVGMLILYEWTKRKWHKSPEGNRRSPVKIDCPNRVTELEPTLRRLAKAMESHEEMAKGHLKATQAFSPIAQRIESGIERLLEETRPGSRGEKVREESRDMLMELVAGQKAHTGLMRELVDLVRNGNKKT